MPENILNTIPPAPPPKRPSVSWVAVLFVIFLTIVLIVIGERFLFDLNRWLNPAYSQYGGYSRLYSNDYEQYVSPTKVYNRESYELYQLLIHTGFVIPVLLAAFLLYFLLHYKKDKNPKRIIAWPYFIFSVWVLLHLVIETFYFLIKEYETLGLYVVLIVLAVLLTWLILFVQRRWHEKLQMLSKG